MKIAAHIAATLLGLAFVMASLMFLLNLMGDQGAPPEGSPPALFMGAIAPSGYLHFVKVLELVGAILVMIPKTRNWGLLILGPIIVNILAFHIFLGDAMNLFDPMMIVICVCAAFLLWYERRKWLGLLG